MYLVSHLLVFEAMCEDALQADVHTDKCSKSYRVEEHRTEKWTSETAASSTEKVSRPCLFWAA